MIPVLLVTGDFVTTGGMDRANHALALFLAQQGRAVELVAYRVADDLRAFPNVTWHRVPKPVNSYTLGAPLLAWWGRWYARQIRARGGRVVVNGGNCPVAAVNWVHYTHAAYVPEFGPGLRGWKRRWDDDYGRVQENTTLRHARTIIANSHATRNVLLQQLRLSPPRVEVIYYGVDANQFYPPTRDQYHTQRQRLPGGTRPLVAFIGAPEDPRKGFAALWAAWQLCATQPGWSADLVVLGGGRALADWQRRCPGVHFLGLRRDVADVLRGCALLVAPTRYEAYGLGVHEALCCGVPALVSADAGVAERYPANLQDWLLADPTDAADIARRLQAWHAAPDGWRQCVLPLTATLRSRSWADMAADLARFLD